MYTFSSKKNIFSHVVLDLFIFAGLFVGLLLANNRLDQLRKYNLLGILSDFSFRIDRAISRSGEEKLTADLLSVVSGGEVLSAVTGRAESVSVLVYHGIVEKAEDLNVSREQFRRQMVALKKAGWITLSLEEFGNFLAGKAELPDKSFLLTFDDGRKDSFYNADPVLEVLGFRAVMFIITGRRETSNFHLTEKEIRQIERTGRWELASHTQDAHSDIKIDSSGRLGHKLTNRLWLENEGRLETLEEFEGRISRELADSKKDIAELYGTKTIAFAFPYGDYGQNSLNEPRAKAFIVAEARKHYKIAFYQASADDGYLSNYSDKDDFMAKRITVRGDTDEKRLLGILESARVENITHP